MSSTGNHLVSAAVAFLTLATAVSGSGFLVEKGGLRRSATVAADFDGEVQRAVGEALGCGGSAGHESLPSIEHQLRPMWRTMSKNEHGRIDRRTLRYMVHRYFMQRSSISVRGFEPSRPSNASAWGTEDILSQRVPAFVEGVLEGRYAEQGFTLEDAAKVVATLEQLIFDSESETLEYAWKSWGKRGGGKRSLRKQDVAKVLERYVVAWIVGAQGDTDLNQIDPSQDVPHWTEILDFVQGQVESFEFQRWQAAASPGAARRVPSPLLQQAVRREATAAAAFSGEFSFDDAHTVVGSITSSFGPFWEDVCQEMKASLVEMDRKGTGRVKLSDFYSEALKTEWRFGESEAYLRQLGALDESSRWHGKQVIIPNYLQAASNCIITSTHYHVCCANECEGLMGEIERAIAEPAATPERILAVVGNLSSPSADFDVELTISGSLRAQLRQIARAHGGDVPLHGRLFAQWLHYVFPRECPFPHKAGSAAAHTSPMDFEQVLAAKEEMVKHAYGRENATADWEEKVGAAPEDAHWMSQWSDEEELVAAKGAALRAPWEAGGMVKCLILLTVCVAILGIALLMSREQGVDGGKLLPTHMGGGKVHLV